MEEYGPGRDGASDEAPEPKPIWFPRTATTADLVARFLEKRKPRLPTKAAIARALGLKRDTVVAALRALRRRRRKPKRLTQAGFAKSHAPVPDWILPLRLSVAAKVLAGWIDHEQQRVGRITVAQCATDLGWTRQRAHRAYRALKECGCTCLARKRGEPHARECGRLLQDEADRTSGPLRYLRTWNRPGEPRSLALVAVPEGDPRSAIEVPESDPRNAQIRPPADHSSPVPYVVPAQKRPPELPKGDPRNAQNRPPHLPESDPRAAQNRPPLLPESDPRYSTSDTQTLQTPPPPPSRAHLRETEAAPPGGGGGSALPLKWNSRGAICRLLDEAGVLTVPETRKDALALMRQARRTPMEVEAILTHAKIPKGYERQRYLSWLLARPHLAELESALGAMRFEQQREEQKALERAARAERDAELEAERERRVKAGHKKRLSFREIVAGFARSKR